MNFSFLSTRQPLSPGFTVVELLIVITVIGILASLSVGQFSEAGKKGRDSERHSDITALKSHLEEYHQDKGGYPSSLSVSTLPRVNQELLTSPDGNGIFNATPVENEYAARQSTTPSLTGAQYVYTPYPTDCTTHCTGYILSTAIELPTIYYDDPYYVSGTYNN